MSEEIYKFNNSNTTVRSNNLFMKICGTWYVMDIDVSNVEVIKDGYGLRYRTETGGVKSLTWDLNTRALRVRVYKQMQFDKEYLLTMETIEDFSDYVTSTYGNIKRDIRSIDTGMDESMEAMLWDLLTSIKPDQ